MPSRRPNWQSARARPTALAMPKASRPQNGLRRTGASNASRAPFTDSSYPVCRKSGATRPNEKIPQSSHLEELDAQFLAEAKQAASARLKTPPAASPAREAAASSKPRADRWAGAAQEPRTRGRRNRRPRANRRTEPLCRQAGGQTAGAKVLCRVVGCDHRAAGMRHRRIFLVAVAAEIVAWSPVAGRCRHRPDRQCPPLPLRPPCRQRRLPLASRPPPRSAPPVTAIAAGKQARPRR
jgi:hypothetical protein